MIDVRTSTGPAVAAVGDYPPGRDFHPSATELAALFERVAPSGPNVTRRKLFGWPAAFVNGNMCCGLHQDSLVLRLPEDAREAFLAQPGARPFEPMPGRPMKGYVVAPAALLADEAALRAWLARAAEWTAALSPKK